MKITGVNKRSYLLKLVQVDQKQDPHSRREGLVLVACFKNISIIFVVGILCGAVPGERPDAHWTRGERPAEVLAEDVQSEGGDVPGRNGGDTWCDWAEPVSEDRGLAVQTDRQMCEQPSLPGKICSSARLKNSIKTLNEGGRAWNC